MKNKVNINVKIGIFVGIASLILMCGIALLKFGYDGLIYDEENRFVLQYFVPIWAIAFGGCGYELSKKYNLQKQAILSKEYPNSNSVKSLEWIKHRRLLFSKALFNIGKVTALMLPLFILAFLDNSKYLVSNLKIIIALFVISCISSVLSKYLKNKTKDCL